MTESKCLPCEIDELQAWKCMMDSMIKFIQASTKLMSTFNDKATSQIALSGGATTGAPDAATSNVSDCKAPCSTYPTQFKLQQKRAREKQPFKNECKAYLPEKKKCVKSRVEGRKSQGEPKIPEEFLCQADCKMCLPSRTPRCQKCRDQLPKEFLKEKSKDPAKRSVDEVPVEVTPTEETTNEEAPAKETPAKEEPTEEALEEESAADETTADVESLEEAATEETPAEEPTEESPVEEQRNKEAQSDEPEVANEGINVPEDDSVAKSEEEDNAKESEDKPELKDCSCQYDKQSKKSKGQANVCKCCPCKKDSEENNEEEVEDCGCEPEDAKEDCICQQPKQQEEQATCTCGDVPQQLCACPLTSAEKIEITEKMTQKLELAQKEINDLKKQLQQLQFSESTKNSNSAKLYKEIMKESSLDKTFNSTAGGSPRPKYYCIDFPTGPQTQMSNSRRPSNGRTPPGNNRSSSYQPQRSNYPQATSSLVDRDFLNWTKSDPTSWQAPKRSLTGKGVTYCSDNYNVCFKRNKQRRNKSLNKLANYSQSAKGISTDYRSMQQPVTAPPAPYYSMYGNADAQNDNSNCDCPQLEDPYASQEVDVVYDPNNSIWQQQQEYQGYNGKNNYINNNYVSDDDSLCDEEYNCGRDDCDRSKGKLLY